MKRLQLIVLGCSTLMLFACTPAEPQDVATGSGAVNLEKQIEDLRKENEQLKQFQDLKRENDALKGKSSKPSVASPTSGKKKPATSEIKLSPKLNCTAKAWDCTTGTCIAGTATPPVCNLIDLDCMNPDEAKPVLSSPKCLALPASAISSSPAPIPSAPQIDFEFNATLAAYIGKAVNNSVTMRRVTDSYSGNVAVMERGYLEQMNQALFKYNGDLGQLQYYQKFADSRALSVSEIQQVTKLEAEMNVLVGSWNDWSDKAYYLR